MVVVGLGLGVGAIVALSHRESMAHPLAATKAIAIETTTEALDNTAEMVRGYIKSMEANGVKIPLGTARLKTLKQLVGVYPA